MHALSLALCLALSFLALAGARSCPSYTHEFYPCLVAAQNGACGYLSYDFNTGDSGDETFCPSSQFCNYDALYHNGTCQNWFQVGQSCASYYPGCIAGSFCNSTGSDGVCKAITVRTTAGESCDNNYIFCGPKLECTMNNMTMTCQNIPIVGQNCTYRCGGSAFCNSETHKCEPLFSVTEGGHCNYDTQQCAPGLFCAGYVDQKCHKQITPSGRACGYEDDCNTYEECSCSSPNKNTTCNAPFVYTQANASSISAMLDCVWTNNCADVDCPACKTSACTYFEQNYLSYYNASFPCNFPEATNNVYKECDFSKTTSSTSSASFLAISFFVSAVAFFATM